MTLPRLAAMAAVLALIGGAVTPAHQADAAPAFRVSVAAPQYDSPGALVPAVVTAHHPPAGSTLTLGMTASSGASVRCVGATWRNPTQATVSRKCYVRLPGHRASLTLTGTAVAAKAGAKPVTRTGGSPRPLLANGAPSRLMTVERAQQVERCFNTTDAVWLTFDDYADNAALTRILATLKKNDVRARFFFTGVFARSNPSAMARIRKEGHLLASHTSTHPALSKASDATVRAELRNGVAATSSPRLLRPPFGAGALTARLEGLAAAQGYRLCRWTTDTYDWEGASVATMVNRVKYGDRRTAPVEKGGVVLMHGQARFTPQALQSIIDVVRAKGLTLERLSR